jgi:hypothetical protein
MNQWDAKEQQALLNKKIGHRIYSIVPTTKRIQSEDKQHYLTGTPRDEVRRAMAAEDYAALTVYLIGEPTTNGGHRLSSVADVTAFIAEHTLP